MHTHDTLHTRVLFSVTVTTFNLHLYAALNGFRDAAAGKSSKPEPMSFAARAAAVAAQQQQEKPPAPVAPEEVKQLEAGKEIAAGKEAAVQAELEAARLRNQLGLDERIAMFKKMLTEKNISVFSTFEKVFAIT